MPRIVGIDIPKEKRVEIALTYIFGVGQTTAKKILAITGVNPDTRVRDLAEEQVREYGIQFMAVKRELGDLLDQVEARGMWPSSTTRTCRSAAS